MIVIAYKYFVCMLLAHCVLCLKNLHGFKNVRYVNLCGLPPPLRTPSYINVNVKIICKDCNKDNYGRRNRKMYAGWL